MAAGRRARFASLGCGNCDTEVRVACLLIERGVQAFTIDCVDINEAMLRRSNQLDAVQQQRGAELNKFGSEIQRKYQSNGYLTEDSYRADEAKFQKMQSDAQNYIGRMQRDIQNEMQQNTIQLNDSISNYLKVYCKEKGYDMVLRKSATFYIDPKFEVTGEVVAGLNQRYNKVEKK